METAITIISIVWAIGMVAGGIWTIIELEKAPSVDCYGNWIKKDGKGL